MKIKGWDLSFFDSGEWQVCDERLRDLESIHQRVGNDGYNPGRKSLFKALSLTPFSKVRVAIIGQDPYPTAALATGLAFSIPATVEPDNFPPTLKTFLKEYSTDLHYPIPHNGDLTRFAERGALLWNAVPSCGTGRSLSHDWPEWENLTREIVTKLSSKGIIFAFLGQVARRFLADVSLTNNEVILTSHPSPRGNMSSKNPFTGSRLFSTINDRLVSNGLEPMDWELK